MVFNRTLVLSPRFSPTSTLSEDRTFDRWSFSTLKALGGCIWNGERWQLFLEIFTLMLFSFFLFFFNNQIRGMVRRGEYDEMLRDVFNNSHKNNKLIWWMSSEWENINTDAWGKIPYANRVWYKQNMFCKGLTNLHGKKNHYLKHILQKAVVVYVMSHLTWHGISWLSYSTPWSFYCMYSE